MAARSRSRRKPTSRRPSVLGNDPFERGAAPRAPAVPPRPEAPQPPAARSEALQAEAPSPPPPPPASPPPAPRAGEAERHLADVVRHRGRAAYIEELRELAIRLVPALRDRLKPL